MQGHPEDGQVKITVPVDAICTGQAYDIIYRIAPRFFIGFLQKNRKYRKVDNSLGSRGVFPDVYRKVGILKDRIWDNSDVVGEPTRDVVEDLIGHLFLMLHMMDAETLPLESDRNKAISEGQEAAADDYLSERLSRIDRDVSAVAIKERIVIEEAMHNASLSARRQQDDAIKGRNDIEEAMHNARLRARRQQDDGPNYPSDHEVVKDSPQT